ncbi:hypothetical protein M3Y99_01016300 [Aphelenchoides fujianensis]|nr:hypothetical protein M3Y99_01016300 [Aphelenchoides fujianensis]
MNSVVRKLLFVLIAIYLTLLTTEARPYADGSISGTILAPWGGNLGGGYSFLASPQVYSNSVRYPSSYDYSYFGRKK